MKDVLLLLARILAGGAFLLAAWQKIQGGAFYFASSIEGFQLLPEHMTLAAAYFVPWLELIVGLTLVLGIWTRQSALIATGLYVAFTGAIASALVRGLDVDCGCFGDMFGGGPVGWPLIARNFIFIAAAAAPFIWGSGRFALEHRGTAGEHETVDPHASAAEAT